MVNFIGVTPIAHTASDKNNRTLRALQKRCWQENSV